jgi:hypothetical protein
MSARGALPGVSRLTDAQSKEYENRVDTFKDEARTLMVDLMQRANPDKQVKLMGAAGDQTWDLARAEVIGQLPQAAQIRLDTGHHVMRLVGGGVGLKLDDSLVASGEGLGAVVAKFKRRFLEALEAELGSSTPGVGIVVFDIDDTIVRGTDDAPRIPTTAALLDDLVKLPRARLLAERWDLAYHGANHHISCFLITARPYSLNDMDILVQELLAADIAIPPHPCSLIMRPAEVHETANGPL